MSVTSDSIKDENIVNIEVDGQMLKARRGQMLIEATDKAGITVPRFCYHNKLSIAANCRMCLVEVEKVPKPLPACATPVTEGMKVMTSSVKAREAQRGTMEFLLINHPLDCPICDQGGECELQELSIGYGGDSSEYNETKRVVADKNLGPLISTEMTRCIHCTRCVRFGDEIAGVREMGATGRGENTHIGTYIETAIDSELSGNIIDLCPVGALTSKPFRFTARAWEMQTQASIAPHDCVGSNIDIKLRDKQVMRVDPRENEQLNECWLSDRDRFSYEAVNDESRHLKPMVRLNGKWQETDWSTALEFTVEGLKKILGEYGPHQVGGLVSPSSTVEEMYLAQKLMRGFGCENIDHRLRQQDFTDQDIDPVFPWLGSAVEDLDTRDAIFLVGSNVRKDQPILGQRIRKAVQSGGSVMALNSIDYDFNFDLAEKVISNPAQMINSLAETAKAALEQNSTAIPEGLAALLTDIQVTDSSRRIAERLSKANHGMVLLGCQSQQHPDYSLLRSLAGTIAEACSVQLGFLSSGANSNGAYLAGVLPHRKSAARANGGSGLNAKSMLDEGLKAYLLLNVEPEHDCADAATATNAMMDAEFVVSLSAFNSKAIEKYANVILPITPFSETSGTYVNTAGDWQSFAAAVIANGEARPAWKVLRVLGNYFDIDGFDHVSSEDVRDELSNQITDILPDNVIAWRYPQATPVSKGLLRLADTPLYAVDSIVRRANALQSTADSLEAAVYINENEANRLSLNGAQSVTVQQGGEAIELPVVIDKRISDGCALIPSGVSGTEGLGLYGHVVSLTNATS